MWIVVALAGCKDGDGVENARAGSLDISPPSISFGIVEFGATATTDIVLRNDGDADADVDRLVTSSDAFTVDEPGPFVVAPGDVAVRSLQWTATSTDGLHEHLSVEHGDVTTVIPVTGTTSYAALIVSPESYDFGPVMIGCERSVDLVLTSAGGEELVVSSIAVDSEQLGLSSEQDLPLELPLTIPARTAATVRVSFAPLNTGILEAELVIDSNDPRGSWEISFDGEGGLPESNGLQWTVEGKRGVTAIINVNEYTMRNGFGDEMEDFLPALFEGLHDANVWYRLGIVLRETGYVSGDIPYIDDSFTVDEAVDAATDMLDGPSTYGDNDRGLETCLNALDENDWLWDDDLWTESRLNLMVVNRDVEQSPGNAERYVDDYADRKNETDGTGDFAVHGIAGPAGGCSDPDDGTYAYPSQNLIDAADLSGGVFIDICSDWNSSVPDLIDAFTRTIETFVLEGTPDPSTIEVTVDGGRVSTGWWYDEVTDTVVFDEATYPPPGSNLRVDYRYLPSCE